MLRPPSQTAKSSQAPSPEDRVVVPGGEVQPAGVANPFRGLPKLNEDGAGLGAQEVSDAQIAGASAFLAKLQAPAAKALPSRFRVAASAEELLEIRKELGPRRDLGAPRLGDLADGPNSRAESTAGSNPWAALGPEPVEWTGELAALPPDDRLHDYQRRNAAVVLVDGVRIIAGPRPPYFSFHGNPREDGQVALSKSGTNVAGNGVYIAQHHAVASAPAHRGGAGQGQVLSLYVNTRKYVPFDARHEREYTPDEAAAFGFDTEGATISGDDLLQAIVHEVGGGQGVTDFLAAKGFNGVAYGYTSRNFAAWVVFDPRVFKRILGATDLPEGEIRRRETFDPTPVGQQIKDAELAMEGVR